jgi:hypothetical protein
VFGCWVRGGAGRIRSGSSEVAKLPEVSNSTPNARALAPELVELRVRVNQVGGEPARISVVSDVDGAFTASLSIKLAEAIACHLYKEVDVSASIERAEDGRIVDACVHEFHPVAVLEAEAKVWRDWFAVAGEGWDDVDDIEGELGGGGTVG